MLIREGWDRLAYAPETGAGAGTETGAEGGGAPPPAVDEGAGAESGAAEEGEQQQDQQRQDGRGSGRSKIRQQLESANEEAKKRTSQQQKGRDQQGRFQAGQEGQPVQQEGQQQNQNQQVNQQQQTAAPEAWSKEAKAAWGQLPPAVQAAAVKREADMAAGVENLKKGYKELDEAIKPYTSAISEHKTTPAAAVKQLFDWMMALTNEATAMKQGQPPKGVFAALAQSYGIDPVRLLAYMVQNPQHQQQQQNGQVQQQGQPQLDPNVKAYIDRMFGTVNQGFSSLASTVQQQSMQKTNEMLSMWAKDKPHFNDVRVTMARLMTPGVNGEAPVVPARQDGNADLDKAYELACAITPDVTSKMQQERQAAEQKAKADKEAAEKVAQRQKLEAARKASGSIPIQAPGVPGDGKQQGPKRGKSVKESIMDAVKEVSGNA
jgi:hypothetical protein